MSADLTDIFGAAGLLARDVPGYRIRPQQATLADAVASAFKDGAHLLADAPTGVGKTFAYLVPAIHHSATVGRRTVVATNGIVLQEQVVKRDLPTLRKVLPWPFSFALLKGRKNYLCLRELSVRISERQKGVHLGPDMLRVMEWAAGTAIGDKSELSPVPKQTVWSKFAVDGEDCSGKECPFFAECHSERARAKAADATIIVVNHHLLFANVAVKQVTNADMVIPPTGHLVIDEAHDAADIARGFFGFKISMAQANQIAAIAKQFDEPDVANAIKAGAKVWFGQLRKHMASLNYGGRLRHAHVADASALLAPLSWFIEVAEKASASLDAKIAHTASVTKAKEDRARAARLKSLTKSARRMIEHVAEVDGLTDNAGKVYWLEPDRNDLARVGAKLVDVAPVLRSGLFQELRTCVMLSATMAISGTFAHVRSDLGVLGVAREIIVHSPFDFRRNARLLAPPVDEMPEHDAPEFAGAVGRKAREIADGVRGGMLILFTSHSAIEAAAPHFAGFPRPVLRQGDMAPGAIVKEMRANHGTVTLATSTFWTGVDLPGDALVVVVIDKLPFPALFDPLTNWMHDNRGPTMWGNYLLPRMLMRMRQGVGRLIRTETDRGVIAILDPRLRTKNYGAAVVSSIPSMPRIESASAAATFLKERL